LGAEPTLASISAAASRTAPTAVTHDVEARAERKKLSCGKDVCVSPTSMNQSSQESQTSSSRSKRPSRQDCDSSAVAVGVRRVLGAFAAYAAAALEQGRLAAAGDPARTDSLLTRASRRENAP
jgi:hypothetical protein